MKFDNLVLAAALGASTLSVVQAQALDRKKNRTLNHYKGAVSKSKGKSSFPVVAPGEPCIPLGTQLPHPTGKSGNISPTVFCPAPTSSPTVTESVVPTSTPSEEPTSTPSAFPTAVPSPYPTIECPLVMGGEKFTGKSFVPIRENMNAVRLGHVSGCDDCTQVVDLPFTWIWLDDRTIEKFTVTSNGQINIGADYERDDNYDLDPIGPGGNKIPRIAIAKEDLDPAEQGDVYTLWDPVARTFTVSFENVAFYNGVGSLNAQAILHTDGDIDICWGGTNAAGNLFVSGVEDDSQDFYQPVTAGIFNDFGVTTAAFIPSECVNFKCAKAIPTEVPSFVPTIMPSDVPTDLPTSTPSDVPTAMPSAEPTLQPTDVPSEVPTVVPTAAPSSEPSALPTDTPSEFPTLIPTMMPTEWPLEECPLLLGGNSFNKKEFEAIGEQDGAELLSVVSNCDDCTEKVDLPFSFPWFDGYIDSFTVSSNGQINIDGSNDNNYNLDGIGPGGPEPNGNLTPRIAIAKEDLDPKEYGGIYTLFNYQERSFTVSFENVAFYNGVGNVNAQAILYFGGEVEICWGSSNTAGNNIVAGLEDDARDFFRPVNVPPEFGHDGITTDFKIPNECVRFICGKETPSATPSSSPSFSPSASPSAAPSSSPTAAPSVSPSSSPTSEPSSTPTAMPSSEPTLVPTAMPSSTPTEEPSSAPSTSPTESADGGCHLQVQFLPAPAGADQLRRIRFSGVPVGSLNNQGALETIIGDSSSNSDGVLLEDFFTFPNIQQENYIADGASLRGALQSASGSPQFRRPQGELNLDIWNLVNSEFLIFVEGEQAFAGTATISVPDEFWFTSSLNPNRSGQIFFPALNEDDIPNAVHVANWCRFPP